MIQLTIPFGSNLMKGIFTFFLLIIIQLGTCTEPPKEDNCLPTQCSYDGPIIQFPFRLQNQSKDCGYPGFELSCRRNETVLMLPFFKELSIGFIDYDYQELYVYDPHGCLARSLLHLNLSTSPFQFSTDLYDNNYKIFNCSSNETGESIYNLYPIPCLRDLPGHFYFVNNQESLEMLSSCRPITQYQVTYSYYYNSDNDNELPLTWDVPDCRRCSNGLCRLNGTNSSTECVSSPSSMYVPYTSKGSNARKIIIGLCSAAFAFSVIVAVIILFIFKKFKAKQKKEQDIKIEKFLEEYRSLKPTRYSYAEIKRMTDNLKNKLGQGGYGNVFKGKLPNGVPVAVKVLEDPSINGEEFINEIGTIGRIHHINIVRLFGFCVDGSKRALIYEFMPNESLEKFIFVQDDRRSMVFSWTKLQEIAIGIARGIEYLHQGCDQRILHFDIKPHNVLLDHKFTPKISDFGLAKLCSKENSIVSMTAARGTMGYIAPEVYMKNSNMVSHKSDVYSFGMLLLEMVGGRKNIDETMGDPSQVYFPEWIYSRLERGEELGLRTERDDDLEIAKRLTSTALWCIQWKPVDRPSMKVVVQMLEGSMESLALPPNPFANAATKPTAIAD